MLYVLDSKPAPHEQLLFAFTRTESELRVLFAGLRLVDAQSQVNGGTETVAAAEDAGVLEEPQRVGKVIDHELVDTSGNPAWLGPVCVR